jgi:hypothetical protein
LKSLFVLAATIAAAFPFFFFTATAATGIVAFTTAAFVCTAFAGFFMGVRSGIFDRRSWGRFLESTEKFGKHTL